MPGIGVFIAVSRLSGSLPGRRSARARSCACACAGARRFSSTAGADGSASRTPPGHCRGVSSRDPWRSGSTSSGPRHGCCWSTRTAMPWGWTRGSYDKPVGGRGGRRGVRLTRRPCLTPAAMRFIESFDPLVKAACVLRERTFLEAEYKAVLTDAQLTGLSSARIATKAEAWRRRRVRKRAREAHTPPMPGFRSTRVADRRRMYP